MPYDPCGLVAHWQRTQRAISTPAGRQTLLQAWYAQCSPLPPPPWCRGHSYLRHRWWATLTGWYSPARRAARVLGASDPFPPFPGEHALVHARKWQQRLSLLRHREILCPPTN